MEEVFGSTAKVLVDTKGTGNMLYLPLDKLTEQRARPLTLDEQRQIPATAPQRQTQDTPAVTTTEASRERGSR